MIIKKNILTIIVQESSGSLGTKRAPRIKKKILKKKILKKKSVEEKNIFCARQLMLMFAFGYMQHAIFYEKIYIRGIERRGCKDGFINFKY